MGLSIGSFLNVVIYRLPRGLSVVSPRSRCNTCGHQLPWYENIPVVSWLGLRGRCSQCGTGISVRYTVVEALTGLLFLSCLARFGWSWELVSALTFVTVLVPLAFIDAELWVLPFELTLPGIFFGIVLMVPRGMNAVVTSVIAVIGCFLVYRLLEWVGWLAFRKEALGAGDKFLLAMVGAFMGWRPILGVMFLSATQGAVFGIASLLINGRAGPEGPPQTALPAATPDPLTVEASSTAESEIAATAAVASETPMASTMATEAAAMTADQPLLPAASPEEDPPTFTPDFLKPALSPLKRLALLPWTVFLQPIPDESAPDATTGEVVEWQPETTALPFGPWIALAALEVMLIAPTVTRVLEGTPLGASARVMFG